MKQEIKLLCPAPMVTRRQTLAGLAGLFGIVTLTGCDALASGAQPPTTTNSNTPTTNTTSSTPTQKNQPSQGSTLFVYKGHHNTIYDIAWSPDGKYIVSGSGVIVYGNMQADNAAHIWEAKNGKEVARCNEKFEWAVRSVAWSPKEQKIAVLGMQEPSGSQMEIFIFDPLTGHKLASYFQKSNNFYFSHATDVTWSPDGTYIGSAGLDMAQIIDANTGQLHAKYPQAGNNQSNVMAWSPDGQTAVSSASQTGHSLQFWSTSTGAAIKYYPGNFPTSVAWSPDGKYIAYQDQQQQTYVWDTSKDQQILVIPGQANPTDNGIFDRIHSHAVAWSPNSQQLAVTSYTNNVQIWNINTLKQSYTYTGHTQPARTVAWSPDGTQLASSGNDQTVRIWQAI